MKKSFFLTHYRGRAVNGLKDGEGCNKKKSMYKLPNFFLMKCSKFQLSCPIIISGHNTIIVKSLLVYAFFLL